MMETLLRWKLDVSCDYRSLESHHFFYLSPCLSHVRAAPTAPAVFRLEQAMAHRLRAASPALLGAVTAGGFLAMQAHRRREAESKAALTPPGVLMMGTGEYTTGFVGGKGADSDKSQGVVGLVCLDLMDKGKINRCVCGRRYVTAPYPAMAGPA